MTELPFLLLAGILGASAASFGQCAISRTIQGKSWITGHSHCDYCGHTLRWYENLPIISFLLQSGKTLCCHQRLSPLYVVSEITVAILTAILVAFLS